MTLSRSTNTTPIDGTVSPDSKYTVYVK